MKIVRHLLWTALILSGLSAHLVFAQAQNRGAYAGAINYPAGPVHSPTNTNFWIGGVSPIEIHYGDFNGDGKVDVAAAVFCQAPFYPSCPAGGSAVAVYLSVGNGTFQEAILSGANIPPSIRSFTVGDFNGDGKLDVAVAADCLSAQDCSAGTLTVLLGNGDGSFTQSYQTALNGIVSAAHTIVVGDFNGDSKLDLAVGISCFNIPLNGCSTGAVEVYAGNGDGTFAAPTIFTTVGNNTLFPVVADFNGDGKADIAAGSPAAPGDPGHSSVTMLLNNGSGSFTESVITLPFSALASLAAGDVNADNKSDLLIPTPGTLQILLGNGNGTFQSPAATSTNINLGGSANIDVILADLNHDAKPDVLIAGTGPTGNNAVQPFLNAGSGNFTAGSFYPFGGTQAASLVAQDFNGDGNIDVAMGSTCAENSETSLCNEGTGTVLLGNADGTLQGATILSLSPDLGSAVHSAIAADVNGDGIPDLVEGITLPNGQGGIQVQLGMGNGQYASGVAFPTGISAPSQLVAADLNGDGFIDIAAVGACFDANCSVSALHILFGNGNGTFQSPVSYPTGAQNSSSLAMGDFNGDNTLDAAVMNLAGSVSVLFGNANGTFQSAVVSDTSAGAPVNLSIAASDFNKDGKAEIALESTLSDGNENSVRIFSVGANAQLGQIGAAYGSGGGSVAPGRGTLAAGDLNGDGNLDIVIANECQLGDSGCSFGSLAVLMGAGNGTFTAGAVQTVPDGNFLSLLLTDVNGDGVLDAIAANYTGVAVFPGTANGIFLPPTVYAGAPEFISTTLAMANLDILQPGAGSIFTAILKNRAGTYLAATSSANPTSGAPIVTLTAHITASYLTNVSPTGSIAFYDGTNLLGTSTLSSGAASITISGLTPGVHTITPRYSGDGTFNAHSGTPILQVVNGPTLQSIAVTPASPTIGTGATQQFTATGTYSDNSTQNLTSAVTWSSSNTNVATITSGGLATGAATGQTTIQAKSASVAGSTVLTESTSSIALTITFDGTSNGTVSDGSQINCVRTNGVVSGTCSANYPAGATVVLTATAPTGSIFYGWSNACTGSGTCSVTMNSSQTVTAKFLPAAASNCSPTDSVWIGGASGNWSVPANWSTGVVPNNGVHVCINNAKTPVSSVTLNVSASIGGLTIDPGNSLTVGNGQELVVSGAIFNHGLITVIANNANTFLTFSGAVSLSGGGTLTLSQTISNGQPILRNVNNGSLTNVDNLIQGAGQFGNNGLVITNQAAGIFNANASLPLQLNSGNVTNSGLIEATNGGTLAVGVSIANQNGTISANGTNSSVQLNSTITGGTVSGTASGVIGSSSTAVLDGSTSAGPMTLAGTYTVRNASETVLAGAINNTGLISVIANNANTFLTFSGPVTLSGGGTVTMTQVISNGQPILRNVNNGSLTNVNNVIQGSGQIGNNGLVITNQAGGTIHANGGFPLQFNSGAVTNQGLIDANSGGILQISVNVTNTNATLLSSGSTSSVQLLGGSSVHGGTLKTLNGGFLGTPDGSTTTIDGGAQAITINGTYTAGNGSDTILLGTINNTGLIHVFSNNANTLLTFSGPVSLTGGGTLFMEQVISNGQPILLNTNNGAINNVNNLIQGAGQIGNNGLLITNQSAGVINANAAFPMQFNSGVVTNQGLIEATAGATLQVSVHVFNNAATMLATGSGAAIQLLGGATVSGGTIASSSGGIFGNLATVTLDGSTQGALTINGAYTLGNGTETVLVGNFINNGAIQIPSNNANTIVTISGSVNLTGSGTVNMTQAISNGQPILRNTNNGALHNVNNLIQGSGQIGNNGLLIENQAGGVIKANGQFPLQFNAGTITNLGLLEAAGGTLQISVTVVNQGATMLSTGTGSAVQLLTGARIQGGTISTASSGFFGGLATVVLDGTTSGPITITGTYTVSNGAETIVVGTITNTGDIQLISNNANSFVTINGSVTLNGGGSVTMNQAIGNGQPILRNANNGALNNVNNLIQGSGQIGNNGLIVNNGPGGTISANGAFPLQLNAGTLTNQGLFIANGASAPGTVSTNGYTQTSTGKFQVAIGGLAAGTQYSQLQNSGTATLAGNLNVVFLNGFQPAVGNQFTIVTSSAISGQFAAINSQNMPSGVGWSATYNANSVVLTAVTTTGGSSTLTVSGLGTGSGTVTDDLGLIHCTTSGGDTSGTCSASYNTGSSVTLTATPAQGSTFNGWDACSGTGTCSVSLNGNQTVSATFNSSGASFTLTLNPIGTGNGTLTDDLGQINCTDAAGVISGACSGTYTAGTVVNLSASVTEPSTFGGWLGACTGTGSCSVTMNSSQNVSASFVPPPQIVNLPFAPGSNVAQMAAYNCPSNPNPSPDNPCLDAHAHALALGVSQVTTPFTLTVQATEVPPTTTADGNCPAGATPSQDFDCRFKSFFTYQTSNNGAVVPLCYPFANGNCVHYTVFFETPGQEPDPSWYSGPVDWTISWNDDQFVPPAPYTGSTPRLYDDPDGFVLPGSPYGTDCSTPMQVGNPGTPTNPPIFCQFVFDITTFYDPNKKVDAGIGGKTKVFNDVVVAIPPANAGFVTVTTTPDSASVVAGSPIGFTINVANSSSGTASNATLNNPLPSGGSINWSISPAYSGPGTCSIAGGVGNQVLGCSFGNLAPSTTLSLHLLSPSSSAGSFVSASTVTASNQQILSIAGITVTAPVSLAFSALTPSQSISYGTPSIALSGKLSSGTAFPQVGEQVNIGINGVNQPTTLGANGAFSASFPTASIPVSATPYVITYTFAGDSTYGPVSDTSTTLTVTLANQTITFGNLPASASYGSTFAATASSNSNLPVTISATGACTINSGTVTMTSGTGTCTLTASQAGNANYRPASLVKMVSATKAASSTAIVSNTPNPSSVSQAVAFGVKVTGTGIPTGNVTVTASTGESCAATLANGAGTCAITFATAGTRTLSASYAGDTNFNAGNSAAVTQAVNGSTASALVLAPSTVDFGTVATGAFSLKTATLTNTSNSVVKIAKIFIKPVSGADSNDFLAFPACPSSLAAKKSCTILLAFIADRNHIGAESAQLVASGAVATNFATALLKATTIDPRPSFSPGLLNFGSQKVGTTSSSRSITLTNNGTTPLILSDVDAHGDFSLAATSTCKASVSLARGQNCRIDVKFSPKKKGPRFGDVTVKDNAAFGFQIVPLFGQGN